MCIRDSYYDENLLEALPEFGFLTDPAGSRYSLRPGPNVLGTEAGCSVQVPRWLHEGRCYVSRRHCTLTVGFDKWTGRLRYLLEDGADGPDGRRQSLNGTFLQKIKLHPGEQVDVTDGQQLGLGPLDALQLAAFVPGPPLLATYRVQLGFNPDLTQ